MMKDVPAITQFKVVVGAALRVRWSFDDIDVTKPPAIVSAFDPRFKGLKILSDAKKQAMKDHLTSLVEQIEESVEEEEEDAPASCKKSALDVLLGQDDDSTEGAAAQEEIQYLAEKPAPRETKPLEWWKLSEHRFPRVAKLAQSNFASELPPPPQRGSFLRLGKLSQKKQLQKCGCYFVPE